MDTTMLERLRVEALASNRDSDRAAILDRFRTMLTRLDEMASSEQTPAGTRSKVTAFLAILEEAHGGSAIRCSSRRTC